MLSSLCCVTILLLAAETGPRLSDAEFFGAMDPGRSEMAAVRAVAQRQDWPAARKAHAEVFRTRQSPRRFTRPSPEVKPEGGRPDTSYADKLLAHQWLWQQDWFDLGPDIDWASNQMNQGESATVEWNASLNRHFHFRQLADAYGQTGEEKYAAEIVAQMLDWIEDCPVLTDRSGNSPYHHAWETLNTARRADRATWILPELFQPLDSLWATQEAFDFVVGRYTSGYGAKRAIQVTHTRAIVFVKPDYWVVVDTLQPTDDQEYSCASLFHLNADTAEVDPKSAAVVTRNAKEANLVVWPAATAKLDVKVVKGIKEEPVQGWAHGPWRSVPTAVITGEGAGTFCMATVLYPLAPGATCPIRSVSLLSVTANDKPSSDTLALRLSFANGQEHTLLVADRPGVRRQCDGITTEAQLFGRLRTTDSVRTFQYP